MRSAAPDVHRELSFSVGPIRVRPNLVLSPMSGVTDSPFRRLVRLASGDTVGLLVTEFVCVEGLTRGNLRSRLRLQFHPELERPLSVQIFGAEEDRMADAAEMAQEAGADIVDINCGCPAPKVVKKGGGADLHRDLPRLLRILRAVRRRVSIPVTLKMRSGWSHDTLNAVEIARAAVDCGVSMLAVHGRTRLQLYSGEADWSVVQAVREAVPVPVVGSGDVGDPQTAVQRLSETGCAGLMVGRAAIMNPWIFRQVHDRLEGREPYVPTDRDRFDLLVRYRALLEDSVPARVVPGRLKQLLARFTKGVPHGHELRAQVFSVGDDLDSMFEVLERFFGGRFEASSPARRAS